MRILKKTEDKKNTLIVEGLDSCGDPYSLFQSVEMAQGKKSVRTTRVPYRFPIDPKGGPINLVLNFFGRYGEPSYTLKLDKLSDTQKYHLVYSLKSRKWEVQDDHKPKVEEVKDIKEDSKMRPKIEETKVEEPVKPPAPIVPKTDAKRVEAAPASQLSEFEIGEKEYGSLASQKEEGSTEVESVEV